MRDNRQRIPSTWSCVLERTRVLMFIQQQSFSSKSLTLQRFVVYISSAQGQGVGLWLGHECSGLWERRVAAFMTQQPYENLGFI